MDQLCRLETEAHVVGTTPPGMSMSVLLPSFVHIVIVSRQLDLRVISWEIGSRTVNNKIIKYSIHGDSKDILANKRQCVGFGHRKSMLDP